MSSHNFSLLPFNDSETPQEVKLTGTIMQRNRKFSITYRLLGPISKLDVPLFAIVPTRTKLLWKETCFELFIAAGNAPPYWEFNISPTGHWNVYRFSSYRQGMQEETAFTSLPLTTQVTPGALELSLVIDLGKIIPAESILKVGIAAVVRTARGRNSYWALSHRGPVPDFHLRDSFLIDIQEEPAA
jgi:hypothetical protein